MTDRILEYLNRVPGAYQADDGRRYWTREQVVEAVKECGNLPPPGYALVPIAPSKLMIDAGHLTYSQETLATEWIARAVWTAMVSTDKLEDQP